MTGAPSCSISRSSRRARCATSSLDTSTRSFLIAMEPETPTADARLLLRIIAAAGGMLRRADVQAELYRVKQLPPELRALWEADTDRLIAEHARARGIR